MVFGKTRQDKYRLLNQIFIAYFNKKKIVLKFFAPFTSRSVHHLNVWSLTVGWNVMSAHITIGKLDIFESLMGYYWKTFQFLWFYEPIFKKKTIKY